MGKSELPTLLTPVNGSVAAAVRYAFNIRGPNLPPAGVTITTEETSYHAGWLNLAPAGSYLWNVKACYAADCSSASAWAATFTFWYLYQPTPAPTTTPGFPTPTATATPYECPTALQDPPDGSTQTEPPTLSWDDCDPGGGGTLSQGWFQLELTAPNQPPLTVILSGDSYDTHWLLLLPDSYAWRVRACQDEDCVQAGPWPDAWSFTYQAPPTPTPQSPQGRGDNGDGGIQTTYAITRRSTYFASASSAQAWLVKP